MSEADNKVLIRRMLAGEVDYLEQWANDAVWTIPGSTKWPVRIEAKRTSSGIY